MANYPSVLGKPTLRKVGIFTSLLSNRLVVYWATSEFIVFALWLESKNVDKALEKCGVIVLLFALVVLWRLLVTNEARSALSSLSNNLDKLSYRTEKGELISEFRDGHVTTIARGKTARRSLQHATNARLGQWEFANIERKLARVQIELAIIGTAMNGFGEYVASLFV